MNLVIAIIISFLTMQQTEKPKLIYIGDPMCSWCYGFTNELANIKEHYKDQTDFIVIMGGLRPYTKEIMDEDLKKFLKNHWIEINHRTNMPFSYDILTKTDFVYDTEPAARAVVVFRSMKPENTLDFFSKTQALFYEKNKDTKDVSVYKNLIEEFDLNWEEFQEKFQSKEFIQKTNQDFQYSQKLGVRGFPTLLLVYEGKAYNITSGYTISENAIISIDKVLGKATY